MSSHRELTLARELAAERADNLRLRKQVAKLEKVVEWVKWTHETNVTLMVRALNEVGDGCDA